MNDDGSRHMRSLLAFGRLELVLGYSKGVKDGHNDAELFHSKHKLND